MTANILTGRRQCARACGYTYWRTHGTPSLGDVRRCEHDRIWMANGRKRENTWFMALDEWDRLSWLWTPIDMVRARRALNRREVSGDEWARLHLRSARHGTRHRGRRRGALG